jgi:hypothetical protein
MVFSGLPEVVTPEVLLEAIDSFSVTERGLQVEIGVSEVGMACQRCVVRKLAGMPKSQQGGSWRAQLGTYVHAGLADEFSKRWADGGEVIVEQSLDVHEYKSLKLRGSCDAFFPNNGKGLVVDWKIVGDDTLSRAQSGEIKNQYVIQGHLYALGWERLGYKVSTVAVMFLPANKNNLVRDAAPISFPYSQEKAVTALAKLENYIDQAEELGWENLLKRHQPLPGCLSCQQYQEADNPVHDLLLR